MPDNAVYYHAAYGVAALIYILYSLRLALKRRELRSRQPRSEP